MGTSSRKTSAQIKKLIEKAREVDPQVDWEALIPDISQGALRAKKARQYFGDREFIVLAGGGYASAKKIREVGIDQFAVELGVVLKGDRTIDIEKIVEAILSNLETEAEIATSLLLNAFKLAFTQYLIQQDLRAEEYLALFLRIVIRMAIEEAAKEELLNQYKETQFGDISISIDEFASRYVQEKFTDLIAGYASGQISVHEFIDAIQAVLK